MKYILNWGDDMTLKIGIIHPNQRCGGGGERVCSYFAKYLLGKGYHVTIFSETGGVSFWDIFDKKPEIRKPSIKIPSLLLSGMMKIYKYSLIYRFFDYSGFDTLADTFGISIVNSLIHKVKLHYFHMSPVKYGFYYIPKKIADSLFLRLPNKISFVCNSLTTKKNILKYLNIDANIIYPPIDTERFVPVQNPTENYFLLTGRIEQFKKFEVALSKLKDENVIIAGKIEDVKYYNMLKRKFPFVKFKTNVSDREIIKLYQNCKAYIFTQRASFGIVPFEAMACEREVIVPEGCGASELIEDGVNGFICKNDFSNFLEKLKQLLNSDLNKKTLRKTIIDNLSINVFGKKMEELLLQR